MPEQNIAVFYKAKTRNSKFSVNFEFLADKVILKSY